MSEPVLDDSVPIHLHTGGCAIGRCRDDRAVWSIMGGSCEGGRPRHPARPRRLAPQPGTGPEPSANG